MLDAKRMTLREISQAMDKFGMTKAIENIFSFNKMAQRYRITYDSSKEDAFIVHKDGKQIKFKASKNRLYYFKPNYKLQEKEKDCNSHYKGNDSNYHYEGYNHNSIETVKEILKDYSARQIKEAQEARRAYYNIGAPSVADFKALIKMNIIQNFPITAEHVDRTERIYGLPVATMKGKTMRQKQNPARQNVIEIPMEIYKKNHRIELHIDVVFINSMPFLSAIDALISNRSLVYMKGKIDTT